MKLYVCYGTWKAAPRGGGHPCGTAFHALRDAGHEPQVKRVYGLGSLPGPLQTAGRREVKRLTGSPWVPVLLADDGTVVQGSREIADWAGTHPAGAARPAAGASPAGPS
ncbi:MAG: glutathione S-transferase N-terminal domain-containing protein [Solirubrobacteraceae bacterium]